MPCAIVSSRKGLCDSGPSSRNHEQEPQARISGTATAPRGDEDVGAASQRDEEVVFDRSGSSLTFTRFEATSHPPPEGESRAPASWLKLTAITTTPWKEETNFGGRTGEPLEGLDLLNGVASADGADD